MSTKTLNRKQTGEPCASCGKNSLFEEFVEEVFQHGEGESAVLLRAMVPVLSCDDCGLEYTDERGEDICHEELCRHLGILAPGEIKEVRGSLTREQFSKLTGIGTASISRWENGSVTQNKAHDLLLRMVQSQAGAELARRIARGEDVSGDELKSKTDPSSAAGVQRSDRSSTHWLWDRAEEKSPPEFDFPHLGSEEMDGYRVIGQGFDLRPRAREA